MLAFAAEAPGPGSMSRALGPLRDYLAAMDRRDRFMAARDQRQHPRRAAQLEGSENEYGQPGINWAFACPAHSSGRTVTASGRSSFSHPRPTGPPSGQADSGRPANARRSPATCTSPQLIAPYTAPVLPSSDSPAGMYPARAPVQLTTGCRQQPMRPLIAGHAFDLGRKPTILNATAAVSTLRFRRQEPGCRGAAYCHGGTPGPGTKFVHRHRRS
jgi:hypothetical protein